MAATAEDHTDPDWTLQTFLNLDLPQGLRAELIDGEIVLVSPPGLPHNNVVFWIARQILLNCPAMGTWQGTGLETPRGHSIPDLVSAPLEWGSQDAGSRVPAGDVDLVVEVTSSRPDDDRHAKRRGYAEAGIPLYLLVDRERGECVLRAEPADGDYQQSYRVRIGGDVPLPMPFGFVLRTDSFLR